MRTAIAHRFEYEDVEHSGAPYDMIRATVNLTTSALLIAIATSLKLPLSTTYVCFMVAMGSSLADRAWGRESAVYRISGVMTVVAGWFVTALGGFLIAFVVGLALIYGGIPAFVIVTLLCGYMLVHSNFSKKGKTQTESRHRAESNEDIIKAIQETGLSRYPVYEEDINDICGVLNARDFLLNLQSDSPKPLKGLLRRAYFVPESVHADQLFKDMQSQKHHFAIVVDEYGGTAGVVTMEDLLEEIVGNIYDEFDPEEPQAIVEVKEGLWRVQGSARVEELADVADIEIPEDADYDTLGGMVMSCLSTIPEDGSKLTVEINGLRVRVEKIEDRKVIWAFVQKLPPEKPQEKEGKDKEKTKEPQEQ